MFTQRIHFSHICIFLLLVVLLFVSGCQSPEENPSASLPLTIGILPDVESIPPVIAEKNGYFAGSDREIRLLLFKSARDRDSALQAGQLDGVITDMVAVLFARSGGLDLKITAATDGAIFLLGNPDRGIHTLSDLAGKETALSTHTVMDYSLDQMLLASGIAPETLVKTAIPQLPTRLEMLLNDQLDAAILPQPLADIALSGGAVWLSDTRTLGEKAGVVAFTASALQEKTEAIRFFFDACNRAAADLNAAAPGTYDAFLIEKMGFPDSLKKAFPLPEYQPASLPDAEIFDHVTEWMLSRQLITETFAYEDVSVNLFTEP